MTTFMICLMLSILGCYGCYRIYQLRKQEQELLTERIHPMYNNFKGIGYDGITHDQDDDSASRVISQDNTDYSQS